MTRIIVVSNRLPVTVCPDKAPPEDIKSSSGGVASAFRSIAAKANLVENFEGLVWIGWPGAFLDNEADEAKFETRLREASEDIACVPVWLTQREMEDFYNGFSNSSLWPLLHWMTPYARFKKAWAECYKQVNEKFADAIFRTAGPADLVWIQDYHFFLVPQMLRRRLSAPAPGGGGHIRRPDFLPSLDSPADGRHGGIVPPGGSRDERCPTAASEEAFADALDNASEADATRKSGVFRPRPRSKSGTECFKIGFFLHVPFPSYEVISALPQCRDIIEGLLGADLVGFHTYSYLRHFRSCMIRICGLAPEFDYVDHKNQRTKLGVFPIGANCEGIEQAMQSERFAKYLKDYTEQFQGKNLVLSVERLDYSKGLPQKLAAVECYLQHAQQLANAAEAQRTEEGEKAASFESEAEKAGDKDRGPDATPQGEREKRLEAFVKRFEGRAGTDPDPAESAARHIRRIGPFLRTWFSNSFLKAAEEVHPLDHSKTVFLFVAVPSRVEVPEYKHIEEEVHRSISTINGQFSTVTHTPIVYIHRSVSMDELAALYARADCCLVTPLIDGMNLVAKEFVVAKDRSKENVVPGTVVISELAGAAQELFDAVVVNPYDEDEVAQGIYVGLEFTKGVHLDDDIRWQVTDRMRRMVLENDAAQWAETMLRELASPCEGAPAKREAKMTELNDSVARRFWEANEGEKALFLDYDGTLREFEPCPADAVPSEEHHLLFGALSARLDLKVFIVSGRPKEFLEEHFGRYGSFSLIAEQGFWRRGPETGNEWRPMNTWHACTDWISKVKPIMELFRRCTPGAQLEEKESGISWHYSDCDEEYGEFKARELVHHLALSLGSIPCQINQGKHVIHVTSLEIKKGRIVGSACQEKEVAGEPFKEVLCIGDDNTDESMFQEAPTYAVTVKVGGGSTCARSMLHSPWHVRRFLGLVARQAASPGTKRTCSVNFVSIDAGSHGQEEGTPEGDPLIDLPEHETV